MPSPDLEAIEAMIARARAGDLEVLPELRSFLDTHPQVWQNFGDLARNVMDSWIGLIAGSDLAAGESLARKAAAMKDELAGPAASPLERLLAERIVSNWLQVNYSDASAAQSAGVSLKQAAFVLKRQDSAHRRYLSALGALAMVRRMLPASAEPCGFRPPVELTWDRAGDDLIRASSNPGAEEWRESEPVPGQPEPLVLFDPALDGSSPGREAGRSMDVKATSAS